MHRAIRRSRGGESRREKAIDQLWSIEKGLRVRGLSRKTNSHLMPGMDLHSTCSRLSTTTPNKLLQPAARTEAAHGRNTKQRSRNPSVFWRVDTRSANSTRWPCRLHLYQASRCDESRVGRVRNPALKRRATVIGSRCDQGSVHPLSVASRQAMLGR